MLFFIALCMAGFMDNVPNDEIPWQWSDADTSIIRYLQCAPVEYDISLTKPKSAQPSFLRVRISNGPETLCEWDSGSDGAFVFSESGSTVVYSKHSLRTTGCTLVAFDLKAKRQVWEMALEGIGPVGEISKWENRINMKIRNGQIIVYGDEGKKYIEVVDLDSGETVSHRTLDIIQFDGEEFEFEKLVEVAAASGPFPVPLESCSDAGELKDGKPWSGTFVWQSHKTALIIEKYKDGKRHGRSVGFQSPTVKHWTAWYHKGLEHGESKVWGFDGRLNSTSVYEFGKLISSTPEE